MQGMIGKEFENLPQRSIYYFLATMPYFKAVSSNKASEEEQKTAYDFVKGIYLKLYETPALLSFKAIPDECFEDWEMQKTKPGLVPKIRGTIKKIEEFILIIYQIISFGNCEGQDKISLNKDKLALKKSVINSLANFNIETIVSDKSYVFVFPSNTVKGLKLLVEISAENAEPLLFSRGVFDSKAEYTREIFGNMLEDRVPFDKLIDFLNNNGYDRIDNREHGISLDYIKCYGAKDEPVKSAWAERTHSGIEVGYDDIRKNQFHIWLRIPYFGELLKQSDKMNEQVKNFITATSKKCDNCRYCIQTDKTGKRPLAFINVDEYKICPLFCGFQYNWKTLNDETVSNMIEMLKFIDEVTVYKI